jgi:hypothetical protein
MDLSKALIGILSVFAIASPHYAGEKPNQPTIRDPVDQVVGVLELHDQTLLDGLAKLNAVTDLGYSVELILKEQISSPDVVNPKFTGRIENATLRNALDWLVQLDGRYSWSVGEDMINIFARDTGYASRSYLFDRKLAKIRYERVKTSDEAVFSTVSQLPGPLEQIAFIQAGGSPKFPKPWTAQYDDISVRQAFNMIARQLGKGWGWTLFGSRDFRVVMFHQRLAMGQSPH